jgi:hypothetical protein
MLFAVLVLILARGMRLDYMLFSTACIIVFLTKHTEPLLQSTPRYILMAFPIFLVWGTWIRRRTSGLLLAVLIGTLYFGMLRTFLWWGLIA